MPGATSTEKRAQVVARGSHVYPRWHRRRRERKSYSSSVVPRPRGRHGDEGQHLCTRSPALSHQKKLACHQPAHAVGHNDKRGNGILELDVAHGFIEMLGQTMQSRARWVVVHPGLKSLRIQFFDHTAEIARRATHSMYEQHGRLCWIVRLEEVHTGTGLDQEVIRRPDASLHVFIREPAVL